MNRFKMNVVNCAMLGAFVCAMPKQPGFKKITNQSNGI